MVEWWKNIDISDKSPAAYFPQYVSGISEKESERVLKDMMYWHALPAGWHEMDYAEFLEARRKAMAAVIRAGFQKLAPTAG